MPKRRRFFVAHRIGHYTIGFDIPPRIAAHAAVAGALEAAGPLGKAFDRTFEDAYLGKPTWEQAESELQRQALAIALQKGGLAPHQIQVLFAGDLLNQCVGSTVGLAGYGIPHVGIYGACSTMALGLLLAAAFVDGGLAQTAGAVTSSHFCASERQFRFPLEYGGQRPPTSQWTATAAGAVIVGAGGGNVAVTQSIVGRIQDMGLTDANNMGAAMAPAAADTIVTFLRETGRTPGDLDLILTGDLGQTGSELLCRLAAKEGFDLTANHTDCGLCLYDRRRQDVHAGGSGCGCSAGVLCAHILPQIAGGALKRVLFVATGSLHSPTSVQQGLAIPGIAHGVLLEYRPA